MKRKSILATTTTAALAASSWAAQLPSAWGAEAYDPFQAYVSVGAGYEDNLFRLSGSAEAEEVLGTDQMDDWFGYASAGFKSQFPGDLHRFEVNGEINHASYDEFDSLDYTGGLFNATGEWTLGGDARGTLGYDYQRRLQSFANRTSTTRDVVQRHGINAGIEKPLAERWQVRLAGEAADLDFSRSELLEKRQWDGEAEIQYAASQQSVFGLLATYTQSDFEVNEARDFSGWSVGPSFEWQVTRSMLITTNLGYTHRGLETTTGDQGDYDGVTGYAAALWTPGDRFSNEFRIFRDVSNLGGEISEYTERTGLRLRPRWQMTPKLAGRFSLAYEERDFSAVESAATNRQDDYLLADVALDFAVSQKLLLTLSYGYEYRDSNVEEQEFDANTVQAEVTLNL